MAGSADDVAAHRAQMHRSLLPLDNERDLSDIPRHVRDALELIPVGTVHEVLAAAIPGAARRLKVSRGWRKAAKTA